MRIGDRVRPAHQGREVDWRVFRGRVTDGPWRHGTREYVEVRWQGEGFGSLPVHYPVDLLEEAGE